MRRDSLNSFWNNTIGVTSQLGANTAVEAYLNAPENSMAAGGGSGLRSSAARRAAAQDIVEQTGTNPCATYQGSLGYYLPLRSACCETCSLCSCSSTSESVDLLQQHLQALRAKLSAEGGSSRLSSTAGPAAAEFTGWPRLSKPRVCAAGGFDSAVNNYESLLSLARSQGALGGQNRGACKRCGQLGHLTKQCRNPLAAADGPDGAAALAPVRPADRD